MGVAKKGKLVVIDGNSLIYRAFYALPLLQNSRGEHTNAVYGFAGMLLKLLGEEKPEFAVVAMDYPAPSFRQAIYPEYKGNRDKTPEELGEQMQRIREILSALEIPVLEVEGYEADDIIATLAAGAAAEELKTLIVSGDADLLQLVDEGVTVLFTRKGISQMERIDPDKLKENMGLEPSQVIDYKALKGDPSDNIPGVPGVGNKTALRLLQEYGTVDAICESIDSLKGKLKENICLHKEQLYTGRRLVTLCREVPLNFSYEQGRFAPDYRRLLQLFEDLEFKSLSVRVSKLLPDASEDKESVGDEMPGFYAGEKAALLDFLAGLAPEEDLALLMETAPGYPYWREPLTAIALATARGESCYLLPDKFKEGEQVLWELFRDKWEQGTGLICSNIKFLLNYLSSRELPYPGTFFDPALAAYLLDPARSSYDLGYLFKQYLNMDLPGQDAVKGKKDLGSDAAGKLLSARAPHLFTLKEKLLTRMREEGLEQLYLSLELPLAAVLARMERQGLAVDLPLLHDLSTEICLRLRNLEEEIYALAGEKFNLNSPQQLSSILFEKLKLPVVRKTKTGRSTDAKVLEELAPRHEIVAKILHYRQLVKLEGTYLSGLIPYVDPQVSKIYTTLNQTVTATGRLSSSEPNLQNIPSRLEEGRRIRQAFIPSSKGLVFLAADYSQIELRILAHLSQDPILVEAFQKDEDVHQRTASEVFHVEPAAVTEEMRKKAKAVNFGIIYGISDYGLAQGLGVPRQEAREYIESYFHRYRGVKSYVEEIIGQARESGFVSTLYHRKRSLPELRAKHFATRSFAERIARNTPIQGSAADIIKAAMLRIDELIRQGGFSGKMLLQIHDELLFEIEEKELPFFAPVIKKEMEEACRLSVPLKVDLKTGHSWAGLQDLEF